MNVNQNLHEIKKSRDKSEVSAMKVTHLHYKNTHNIHTKIIRYWHKHCNYKGNS